MTVLMHHRDHACMHAVVCIMHDESHDPVHIAGGSPSSPRTEWEAARAAKTSASNRNSRRRGKNKKDKTEEKFVSKVRDTTVDGV